MKLFRTFFVFAFLLFVGQAMAQDATVTRNGTNFKVALTAADTTSGTTTTVSKSIGVGAKQAVQFYSIQVTVDSLSGTPAYTIYLDGSMDNSAWVNITSQAWAGSASDTTVYFTDVSTGIIWPYVRVRLPGASAAKSQLTELIGRFMDKVR